MERQHGPHTNNPDTGKSVNTINSSSKAKNKYILSGLPQQSDNLTASGVKEDLHVQRQEERGHLRDQRRRGLRDQEVQGAGLH